MFRGPKPDNFPKNKIVTKKEQRHIDYVESYQNPLGKAMEFERIMKDENLSQSALSEKLGVSRVRVTQILNLLKLPKEKIEYILKKGKDDDCNHNQAAVKKEKTPLRNYSETGL